MRLVALCLLTGCLSVPPPRAGGADAGSDGPHRDGSSRDAPLTDGPSADAPPLGPGSEWPPIGMRLALRPGAVADLDGDGHDDLVLLNPSGDAGSQGLFVFMGRPHSVVRVYDTFVPTGDARPLGATLAQLGGDGRADLLVMAATRSTTGGPYDGVALVAFEGTGRGGFTERGRAALPGLTADPDPWFGRAFATVGHFRSDGAAEIVVGAVGDMVTGTVAVVSLDAWSPFAVGAPRPLAFPTGLGRVAWRAAGALALRAPTGRDDLFVADNQFVVWFQSTPSGLLTASTSNSFSRLGAGYQWSQPAPFPGDTTASLWGGGANQIGATRIDLAAATSQMEPFAIGEDMDKIRIGGDLAHFVVAELDGDAAGLVDVAALGHSQPAELRVYPNPVPHREQVIIGTPLLLADTPIALTLTAPDPVAPEWLLTGSFSAPRQVLTLDASSGRMGCYRIEGGTLVRCGM